MPLLLKRRLRKSVTLSKNSPVVKSFHAHLEDGILAFTGRTLEHVVVLDVPRAGLAGFDLRCGQLELGVGERDVVHVEEHAQLGPTTGVAAGLRVVVDDAVAVGGGDHSGEVAGGGIIVELVGGAGEAGQPLVAHLDAIGDGPCVGGLRRARLLAGQRGLCIGDEDNHRHDRSGNDGREGGAAGEADLLALASRCEFGDFASGR